MPIYPPRNSAIKKSQILERRLFEFLQLHKIENYSDKHLKLSEKVRVAQLNYLKARLTLCNTYSSDKETNVDLINKIQKEISDWKLLSYDEIVDYCLMHSKRD